MSQHEVERVIGRAVTDADFRKRLIDNAHEACKGFDLTAEELDALEKLDGTNMANFSATLDPRISKSGGVGFIK